MCPAGLPKSGEKRGSKLSPCYFGAQRQNLPRCAAVLLLLRVTAACRSQCWQLKFYVPRPQYAVQGGCRKTQEYQ